MTELNKKLSDLVSHHEGDFLGQNMLYKQSEETVWAVKQEEDGSEWIVRMNKTAIKKVAAIQKEEGNFFLRSFRPALIDWALGLRDKAKETGQPESDTATLNLDNIGQLEFSLTVSPLGQGSLSIGETKKTLGGYRYDWTLKHGSEELSFDFTSAGGDKTGLTPSRMEAIINLSEGEKGSPENSSSGYMTNEQFGKLPFNS